MALEESDPKAIWKTRLVQGKFPDREFDIEFWQEQGDEAIFQAAWEMVELVEETKHGRKPTLLKTVTRLVYLGDSADRTERRNPQHLTDSAP